MALPSSLVWEVRDSGDTANGGGFNPDRGGTDYSQSDSAAIDFAATLSTPAASDATLVDSLSRFTSDMVGNVIQISSGSNFIAGFYEIISYTSASTVELDRFCSAAGAGSGGVGSLGGANSDFREIAENQMVAGNRMWVTGSFSYSTRLDLPHSVGTPALPLRITGYNTVRGDATGPAAVFTHTGSQQVIRLGNDTAADGYWILEYLDTLDGSSGFFTKCKNNVMFRCRAYNSSNNAFNIVNANNVAIGCEATLFGTAGGERAGFRAQGVGSLVVYCVARDDSSSTGPGIWCDGGANAVHCIAEDCNKGFYSLPDLDDSTTSFVNCTAHNNTSSGFEVGADAQTSICFVNCLATGNGGYGFQDLSTGALVNFIRCAHYGNSSGGLNTGGLAAIVYLGGDDSSEMTTLSANPMVDPDNGDFSIRGDETDIIDQGFGDFLIDNVIQGWRKPEIGAVLRARSRRRT